MFLLTAAFRIDIPDVLIRGLVDSQRTKLTSYGYVSTRLRVTQTSKQTITNCRCVTIALNYPFIWLYVQTCFRVNQTQISTNWVSRLLSYYVYKEKPLNYAPFHCKHWRYKLSRLLVISYTCRVFVSLVLSHSVFSVTKFKLPQCCSLVQTTGTEHIISFGAAETDTTEVRVL